MRNRDAFPDLRGAKSLTMAGCSADVIRIAVRQQRACRAVAARGPRARVRAHGCRCRTRRRQTACRLRPPAASNDRETRAAWRPPCPTSNAVTRSDRESVSGAQASLRGCPLTMAAAAAAHATTTIRAAEAARPERRTSERSIVRQHQRNRRRRHAHVSEGTASTSRALSTNATAAR